MKKNRSLLSIALLKPTLQFRYVSIVFFSILFVCIAMGFYFHFAVVKKITVEFNYAELRPFLVQTNIIMVGLFLAFSVIVLVFAILISHKFAGPIYRFEKTLQSISEGNLSQQVFLRKDDELLDLKDTINHMISNLQLKIFHTRHQREDIIKQIDIILNQSQPDLSNPAFTKQTLEKIREDISKISDGFTL